MTCHPTRRFAPLAFALLVVAGVAGVGCAVRARADEERPAVRGRVTGRDGNRGVQVMDAPALVDELRREGITDERVLDAILRVPRHEFVPPGLREEAYENYPLPIGEGQTISQPYIVAFMTAAARVERTNNVLEVGTGSGYQSAVLAHLLGLGPGASAGPSGRLSSIETIPSLGESARLTLSRLGYSVDVRIGDGYRGWAEKAPFDVILVTAAPDHVPEPLKQQLAVGGRLVIPVGDENQQMTIVTRTEKGYREETVLPVRFVPMTGEAKRR